MPMPKIKLPTIGLPKVNAWKQALDKPTQYKYTRESPLTPAKEGYPIVLYKGTPPNKGITIDDLETEPIKVVQNTPTGPQIRLIPAKNPYLMKGATEYMSQSNAKLDAENDKIAVGMASQWRGNIKNPSTPYTQLLKKDARNATPDEIAEAISNIELEERSKAEEERAVETYTDNEKRASDPTGNPTWILRTPGQGPDKTFR